MRKLKTVKVEWLLEKANYFLENSAEEMQGERRGIASFIDTILFHANSYAGYCCFDSKDDSRRRYFSK